MFSSHDCECLKTSRPAVWGLGLCQTEKTRRCFAHMAQHNWFYARQCDIFSSSVAAQTWVGPVTHWPGSSWLMSINYAARSHREQKPGRKTRRRVTWWRWESTWSGGGVSSYLAPWIQLLTRWGSWIRTKFHIDTVSIHWCCYSFWIWGGGVFMMVLMSWSNKNISPHSYNNKSSLKITRKRKKSKSIFT